MKFLVRWFYLVIPPERSKHTGYYFVWYIMRYGYSHFTFYRAPCWYVHCSLLLLTMIDDNDEYKNETVIMMQWDLECFVYCMWWIYGFTYCTAHTPPHTYSIWWESNFINQSSYRSDFGSYTYSISTHARTCGRSNSTRVVLYLRYPSASDFGCCGCWWNDTWYRSLVSNNISRHNSRHKECYCFMFNSF